MKKIIGILRPFDYEQRFLVYEDGNKIDSVTVSIEEVPETIFELVSKYEIQQIDLTGPKQYSKGISQKILALQPKFYCENNLEINLI